jgi:hypothetical protein
MNSPFPLRPVFTAPAKKQLGQHFLADRHYIDKIVMAVNPKDGDRLVEIRSRPGRDHAAAAARASKLTVIEFDRDLIAPLTAAAEPLGELTIVHRDVLRRGLHRAGCRPADPPGRQPALQHLLADPVPCAGMPPSSATCTSCCRRKWSTAWPLAPAARCMAASA